VCINLNVGNRWERSYLDQIIKLNKKHKRVQVKEMYGSVAGVLTSVRPDYRVPKVHREFMHDYIKRANDNGIEINYTFNRSCIGSLGMASFEHEYIQNVIQDLEGMGVARFTIASPFLMESLVYKHIEVSTIVNQPSIKAIVSSTRLASSIDKVCLPLYMNRSFGKLKVIDTILTQELVTPELMVNEFCAAEDGFCVRRDECYRIQSHGGNPIKDFHNYPAGACISARGKNPVNWLRAPFILPEDMGKYKAITGINHFKVTGRTHSAKSLLKVIGYYMDEQSPKSLCDLWGIPLEKVYGELGYKPVDIPTAKLKKFLTYFIKSDKDCLDFVCGTTCNYCKDYYYAQIRPHYSTE